MKRMVLILGVLAVSTSAYTQTTAEIIERALAAAPGRAREGAAVITWNPDHTWPARCFIPVRMRVYITADGTDLDADGGGIARR